MGLWYIITKPMSWENTPIPGHVSNKSFTKHQILSTTLVMKGKKIASTF